MKEKASLLLKQNIHVDSLCLRVLKYVCNVDKDNNNDCLELSDVFKSIWSLSEDDKEEERLFTSCVKGRCGVSSSHHLYATSKGQEALQQQDPRGKP